MSYIKQIIPSRPAPTETTISETPLNILQKLPPEVRVQIWTYAQTSSTGYLKIRPLAIAGQGPFFVPVKMRSDNDTSPEPSTFPSLLYTSKSIYQEANGLVFSANTIFYISNDFFIFSSFQLPRPTRLRMQHIWLNTPIWRNDGIIGINRALLILARWRKRGGNLKTLTVGVFLSTKRFEQLVQWRKSNVPPPGAKLNQRNFHNPFHRYMCVFRNHRDRFERRFQGVTRRLELTIDDPSEKILDNADARDTVKDMHDAFGGELWINDRLRYREGEEVSQKIERHKPSVWLESKRNATFLTG